MNQVLSLITLLIDDYDRAIQYYTQVLLFELIEDTTQSPTKRWVVVSPKGRDSCKILLAKAANDTQASRVGNQTGGRVFLFLHTDDIDRDLKNLEQKNVKIVRPISEETYGKVLVFEDIYGNLWDLIEPKND